MAVAKDDSDVNDPSYSFIRAASFPISLGRRYSWGMSDDTLGSLEQALFFIAVEAHFFPSDCLEIAIPDKRECFSSLDRILCR